MQIRGEWYECDDGLVRPILRGFVLASHGSWEPALFLVDTGADHTVFSAAMLDVLALESLGAQETLGGVGGLAQCVPVPTQIRFPLDGGGTAVFRGEYAAMLRVESLDMSVLGRDVLGMFAVIVDRPGNAVILVRHHHRYKIEVIA